MLYCYMWVVVIVAFCCLSSVTCYSTSPTRIPDYRRQHHRSDGKQTRPSRMGMGMGRESRVVDLTVTICINERASSTICSCEKRVTCIISMRFSTKG
ncbi:hypothetical protein PUN28_003484 [Cardiocondyla obscurior]|uniref:Secreted protein n=1 Tax=Cardiocondyla obscurior TaxID=286306 RepID=A0AAW2GLY6_9HYME